MDLSFHDQGRNCFRTEPLTTPAVEEPIARYIAAFSLLENIATSNC